MASAVAKRSDHPAARSASWSVMHGDEEMARILQKQEEKEYHDHLAAKELQSQSDHKLARFLSERDGHFEGRTDIDAFRTAQHHTTQSETKSSSSHSVAPAVGTSAQNATVISISDSDADFSDCFDDTTFEDLANVLEHAQNEAEQLLVQQEAADSHTRNEEIAEVLQNDDQMNEMLEGEGELSVSNGEFGDTSFEPFVISPSSAANNVPVGTSSDLSNRGGQAREASSPIAIDVSTSDDEWTDENESVVSQANDSLSMSVNIAWNAVGSAVNWVSGLFSGVQSTPWSSLENRVRTSADCEADEEDEDEDDEELEWEEDDGSDLYDDEYGTYDEMDSDMDDTDDDENIDLIEYGDEPVNNGLVQEEINVLPTRTYQSRPPQLTTTGSNTGASANEHQIQNECQICLSNFVDGEVLRTLPCCHLFHSECIDIWLQRNAICPVCRVRIRDEIDF